MKSGLGGGEGFCTLVLLYFGIGSGDRVNELWDWVKEVGIEKVGISVGIFPVHLHLHLHNIQNIIFTSTKT